MNLSKNSQNHSYDHNEKYINEERVYMNNQIIVQSNALIQEVCSEKSDFLKNSFNRYSYLYELTFSSKIQSIQFFDSYKNLNNKDYYYFGSAVSKKNYYADLLVSIFEKIIESTENQFYILGEIQNPKIYSRLKEIFNDICSPKNINIITKQESEIIDSYYRLFPHLLDKKTKNPWISLSNEDKSFCNKGLSESNENLSLLRQGISLRNGEQILFLIQFPIEKYKQLQIISEIKKNLRLSNLDPRKKITLVDLHHGYENE